jgi:4-amino-4-deoxy-L-arabinose transferase-like glycosyltransferase
MHPRSVFVLLVIAYLALAAGTAMTRRPYTDEGELTNPSYTLVHRGYMAVTLWEAHRDSHKAYWVPPGFLLAQAAWQAAVGFGVIQLRLATVVWGLILLLSLRYIVTILAQDRKLALAVFGLLGLDYTFLMHAGIGRCEMMSCALAMAGIALYLKLQARSNGTAILVSHAFMACSALTHPVGAMLWFPCLAGLQLLMERGRFRWNLLLWAGIPYCAGAFGWGLYIFQDPAAFQSQFGSISLGGGRLAGIRHPLLALQNELARFTNYYGIRPAASLPVRLKMLLPLGYLFGLAAALLWRALRTRRIIRYALALFAVQFLLLALVEGTKQYQYILHVIPTLVTILAATLWYSWEGSFVPRAMTAAVVVGLVVLQIGPTMFRIRENRYRNEFLPTVEAIRPYVQQGADLVGMGEFGIPFGFPDNLVTDPAFAYGRAKRPDFVVVDTAVYTANMAGFRVTKPHVYRYLADSFQSEFEPIFQRGEYVLYRRRAAGITSQGDGKPLAPGREIGALQGKALSM